MAQLFVCCSFRAPRAAQKCTAAVTNISDEQNKLRQEALAEYAGMGTWHIVKHGYMYLA